MTWALCPGSHRRGNSLTTRCCSNPERYVPHLAGRGGHPELAPEVPPLERRQAGVRGKRSAGADRPAGLAVARRDAPAQGQAGRRRGRACVPSLRSAPGDSRLASAPSSRAVSSRTSACSRAVSSRTPASRASSTRSRLPRRRRPGRRAPQPLRTARDHRHRHRDRLLRSLLGVRREDPGGFTAGSAPPAAPRPRAAPAPVPGTSTQAPGSHGPWGPQVLGPSPEETGGPSPTPTARPSPPPARYGRAAPAGTVIP